MTPGELFARLRREAPERTLPDRFPLYADNPYRSGHLELERQGFRARHRLEIPRDCAAMALAAVERAAWDLFPHERERPRGYYDLWMDVFATLIRRKIALSAVDAAALLALLTELHEFSHWYSWRAVLRAIEGVAHEPEVALVLRRLRTVLDGRDAFAEQRRFARAIDRILTASDEVDVESEPGESWTSAVPYEERDALPLLLHAQSVRGTRPSRAWRQRATKLVEAFGADRFAELAIRILAQAARTSGGTVGERNGDLLKGLSWMARDRRDADTVRTLGALAEAMFRKVPGVGARSTKVGNACVILLGEAGTLEAVAQLERLETRVRYAAARRRIRRALSGAAERAGLTRLDLEEAATPDLGFDADGRWRRQWGEVACEVRVDPSIEAVWSKGGKRCRSVPAVVRRKYAAELRTVRALVREARRILPAQRARIEGLLLIEREWPFEAFAEHYLDHPLMRHLARRLVWIVDGRAVCWNGEELVDSAERPVAREGWVSLWHPLDATDADVQAWRLWLHLHGVRQPFKQAHRELFRPGDPSQPVCHGFVGRPLHQHQLAALCRQRGWRYRLMGRWDARSVPQRDLPGGFTAEFHVLAPEPEAPVSDRDVFLFVTADIVRFLREGEPVGLDEVPPRLFSEALRDVALFVGVASQPHRVER